MVGAPPLFQSDDHSFRAAALVEALVEPATAPVKGLG